MQRRNEQTKKSFSMPDSRKIFLVILMWSFIIFMLSSLIHSWNIRNEKVEILNLVEQDVERLRIDNLMLVLEQNEVVSHDYIEKEARDQLRYSKDGEMVIIIPEELFGSNEVEQELYKAKGIEIGDEFKSLEEVIEIWVDFLFVSGV